MKLKTIGKIIKWAIILFACYSLYGYCKQIANQQTEIKELQIKVKALQVQKTGKYIPLKIPGIKNKKTKTYKPFIVLEDNGGKHYLTEKS